MSRQRKVLPTKSSKPQPKAIKADRANNFRGMGCINPPNKNAAKGAFKTKIVPDWKLQLKRFAETGSTESKDPTTIKLKQMGLLR